jgi:hypothetical protein
VPEVEATADPATESRDATKMIVRNKTGYLVIMIPKRAVGYDEI